MVEKRTSIIKSPEDLRDWLERHAQRTDAFLDAFRLLMILYNAACINPECSLNQKEIQGVATDETLLCGRCCSASFCSAECEKVARVYHGQVCEDALRLRRALDFPEIADNPAWMQLLGSSDEGRFVSLCKISGVSQQLGKELVESALECGAVYELEEGAEERVLIPAFFKL
ncbi:hypothetical protein HMN09_01210500 [Mycena chlorophos]|uniref:Uncharacterized protein n=1 Tax=Mycena chlorophos TaxID=658473 RepID=A0A8H6VVD0_MYCCL|nr:hypothetical protein HMN09_01210500 [Mycena chlorophos]